MALEIATTYASNNAVSTNDATYDITGALTLICWVYYNSFGLQDTANTSLIDKISYIAAGEGFRLASFFIGDSVNNRFNFNINGNTKSIQDTTNISLNTWYYVAAVYNPSTRMDIYWAKATDASLTNTNSTVSIPASITTNNNTMLLGNRPGVQEALDGYLDHCRVYDRALSQEEIEALRWRAAGINEFPNCVSAWRLDNTSTCIDYKQAQNGSPTVVGISQSAPVAGFA